MSQRSPVTSTQESFANPLHPTVKRVLSNLDINLEKELAQYRRHRKRGEQWIPPARRGAVSLGNVGQSTPSGLTLPEALPSQPSVSPSERLLLSGGEENRVSPSALVPLTGDETVGEKPATVETGLSPEKNLESTEALLKSVDKPKKASRQSDEDFLGSLFSPLGVLSMLLFFLSCATLGYVMRPTLLTYLGFNSLVNPSGNSPAPTGNSVKSVLPKSPNLITKEFVELDLSTLSNVSASGRPLPIPSPLGSPSTPPSLKPIPTQNISNPVGVKPSPDQGLNNLGKALLTSPSPSPSPVNSLSPTPSPVAQTPNPTLPSPSIKPTPTKPIRSKDGLYYVVMDFDGVESLQRARKVVSDAYLRPDFSGGNKIQLGALNTPQEAEILLKELKAKGLSAYYQP